MQNTVAYEDLGVATSGVTFFRTLGSSFGAAVFGTVYANVLSDRLPAAIAASPGVDPAAVTTPEALHAYPGRPDRADRRRLRARDARRVPRCGAGAAGRLRPRALPQGGAAARHRAEHGRATSGEGFGMPEGADAKQQLQIAIARLLQRKGRTHLPLVRERSGSTMGPSDGWAVGQVYLRARLDRPATIEEISRRYQLPAAVLEPAFADATRRGYLVGADGGLRLTQRGQDEIGKVITAMRAWLAEELSDWDVDDAQLNAALGDLATRFVEESPELTPQPRLAIASGETDSGVIGSSHAAALGREGARRDPRGERGGAPGAARDLRAADAEVRPCPPRGDLRQRGRRAAVRGRAAAPEDPSVGRLRERGAAGRWCSPAT